ncbi:dynamin family protein [Pseudalkalibacillus hwajinpoensis]|uniref:Dynamin N-terminal domain-containing protein n=1 Tax=Guptibacillus hwajinpoensis TaxID=208199 RepID=A0A4U1MJJ6_9BACL|nr:dynamin family protein [Pseudalkalibacillus hwajinpoensis]TKD70764.1 hypothetical protein FBF83_09120 [Pseudalkalibacillus hwajinpoensis]
MNHEEKKATLERKADSLQSLIKSIMPDSPSIPEFQNFIDDLREDYYTVVVVGEFKHGKSTFVNALLGQELMPVDVTPTTATIHAVMHADEPRIQVVKQSGEVENHPLSKELLNGYTATADFEPEEIKYLKIFLSSNLLKNKVILVDTPGVNDLNQQRSDVTHSFIPRADVVLFMLSMTSPVKRTEQEFMENHLSAHDQTIYLANFMDRIDEEEMEDVLDTVKSRIQKITGKNDPRIYPISALEGLQGKLENNEQSIQFSGVGEVENEIESIIKSSNRNKVKMERFQIRFNHLLNSLLDEIKTIENVSKASIEELQMQLSSIEEWMNKKDEWENRLRFYLGKREEEISYMALKSADHFGERLRSDLLTKVELYTGNDIKNLVQTQLPITLQNGFKQWIDQYSDYLGELLRKLQVEVSRGLSKSFKQSIKVQVVGEQYHYLADYPILDTATGNASIKAGAVLGGASTVALLLGGPFLIPIVGMAGLPFLQQKIAERQLEKVKPEVKLKVNQHLDATLNDFKVRLQHYLSTEVQEIKKIAIKEFTSLVIYIQEAIQKEVHAKSLEKKSVQHHLTELSKVKAQIELYKQEEEQMYGRI